MKITDERKEILKLRWVEGPTPPPAPIIQIGKPLSLFPVLDLDNLESSVDVSAIASDYIQSLCYANAVPYHYFTQDGKRLGESRVSRLYALNSEIIRTELGKQDKGEEDEQK